MTSELPEYRPLPLKGVPLAVKMTVVVGMLVALFMAGFGLLLHGTLEDTIRAQIQHEAINAARTAAQADLETWTWSFDTIDEGLTATEIQARVDTQTPEAFQAYDEDPERLDQVAWNRGRAARILGEDTRILAVEVFRWRDGARGPTVAAAYPPEAGARNAEFTVAAERAPVVMGRGEAQEGLLTAGEHTWHVIRGSHPIVGRGGAQEGEVVVHIHARAIDAAAAAFSERVTYAGAALMVVSVLIAFVFARRLTSPMRRLRDDARAVMSGDLHHHTRPHSADEIGQLARTFETMTRWLAHARDVEHEAEAYRHELEAAADVTASLFPRVLPAVPGWSLGGLHDREARPGGGTYDVLAMPGGQLGVFVAEASSGGAPGALAAAMARSTLRFVAERQSDPGAALREANARLAADLGEDLEVAVVLVVLDPATGRVAVANAGHRPVLHHRAAGGGLFAVQGEGKPLGAAEGEAFDAAVEVKSLTVAPGDTLVMFASQISMLTGPEGEVLGEKRLAALVKQVAGQPADRLVEQLGETLRRYHGGDSLGADVTLVAVGRDPAR